MYTLRIINSEPTVETRRNRYLGDYDVHYREEKPQEYIERNSDGFEKYIDRYIAQNETVVIDDKSKIRGFVEAENCKLYAFLDTDIVYIVNQEGKTIERVYGMYQPKG